MRSPSASAWPDSSALTVSADHADLAAGRGDRVRHGAARARLQGRRDLPRGRERIRQRLCFLPLEAAQVYFQKPDAATQIEVMVTDPDRVTPCTARSSTRCDGTPVQIIDWTQSNNSFFAAVQVEQNVMFLILTLIILVAAFNVISSLIMMVKDKTRDIAVLRTLGARPRRGDAHLPDVRRFGRLHWHRARPGARRAVLLEHRHHPALGGGDHRHVGVQSRKCIT